MFNNSLNDSYEKHQYEDLCSNALPCLSYALEKNQYAFQNIVISAFEFRNYVMEKKIQKLKKLKLEIETPLLPEIFFSNCSPSTG